MKTFSVTEFVIGRGAEMTGTVSSPGLIRVEGRCKGTLRSGTEVVLARDALMDGDIDAGSVVIAGTYNGTIVSKGLVTLSVSAKVTGDIHARSFRMEEGAFFDGTVTRTVG